ncbi:hypothetical protein HPB49_002096 [Dermacentor silvarum]|uniref:Uncharacterized protein n=1 Tax=Dermacentor silvarum TaxID=543639 RepID=A0ACB8DTC2_DERSI|nr:hypothetical protein HPB49_002096 [Dermacentor silvarum]
MSENERELSRWLLNVYVSKQFNYLPTFVEYVYKKVRDGECKLVPDPNSDKYDITKYNKETGVCQHENIANMVIPLQNLLFKTILHNMTFYDPDTPVDVMFKLHENLGNIINQQRQVKLEPTVADLITNEAYSSDYLVFCNGTTYNCQTATFEKWSERHVCMHRVELDPSLGERDLIEHYTIEIHPLRGGKQYLHRMIHHFIYYVHEQLNVKNAYRTQFATHDMTTEYRKAELKLKKMNPATNPDAYVEQAERVARTKMAFEKAMLKSMYAMHGKEAVEDIISRCEENDEEYVRLFEDACTHYAVLSFLDSHPDVYNEIIEKMQFGSSELDDGGPVVLVKHQLTYEEKLWAIFDDLFGSRTNSTMVMKFLALAMRNGENGRHMLYLHGEAANGKSLFMNILAASMGGSRSKLVINLNGEYFTNRNGNTLDATFRGVNPDVRYLFVCEMPVLDMGNRGIRLLKRFTGNDMVSVRAPYATKNREFRNTAKIVATSNELPYFKAVETAEITRFLIMSMRGFFMTSIATIRMMHLIFAVNARAQCMLFNMDVNIDEGGGEGNVTSNYNNDDELFDGLIRMEDDENTNSQQQPCFPMLFSDLVEMDNQRANVMFECDDLTALKTILTENTSIFREYKAPQLRHVPVVRYMYGDKNLLNNNVIEKFGAALIRILTNHIIPEMGGAEEESKVVTAAEAEEEDESLSPVALRFFENTDRI